MQGAHLPNREPFSGKPPKRRIVDGISEQHLAPLCAEVIWLELYPLLRSPQYHQFATLTVTHVD